MCQKGYIHEDILIISEQREVTLLLKIHTALFEIICNYA
jgi:hypothetical protein